MAGFEEGFKESEIKSTDGPIQILKYNYATKSFEIDVKLLSEIFNANDVRDCDIAVISIAGAFRKGKSFMLSFFLRYLKSVYEENNTDWLGDDSESLEGFSWVGGAKRHTTGMWVWSKMFTATRSNGHRIAVMLMDTQGTWDSETTMAENVTIFSLSQMLSSVQIFNLFNNIQEDDLHHLQLFTEYGRVAKRGTDDRAFQVLMFLIRDWSYPYEHENGFKGGRELLDEMLVINDSQPEENQKIREHLESCYDEISCCLMPSPGSNAIKTKQFKGELSLIEADFKDTLKEFVPALLHPDKVVIKKIGGHNIKAKNFVNVIECYFNMFKKGSGIPSPRTILNATAEANNLNAKEEALEYYRTEMYKRTVDVETVIEFKDMIQIHSALCKDALEIFTEKAVIGEESQKAGHYNKLQVQLEHQLILYIGQNEAKKAKSLDETIQNLTAQIESFRAMNDDQCKTIDSLRSQLHDFQNASVDEKKEMLEQIAKLQEGRSVAGVRFEEEILRLNREAMENNFRHQSDISQMQHEIHIAAERESVKREYDERMRANQEERHRMELKTAQLERDLEMRNMTATMRTESEANHRAHQQELRNLNARIRADEEKRNKGGCSIQ